MEIEDGAIWVYGVGEDGVIAFKDSGIEELIDLIKIYESTPRFSSVQTATNKKPCGASPKKSARNFRGHIFDICLQEVEMLVMMF